MAVAIWTFFDYVSPAGVNEIGEWYSALLLEEQEVFEAFWPNLAKMQKIEMPYAKMLSGRQYSGLFELIFTAGEKQHRVLAMYGPSGTRYTVTMLLGCTHKQKVYKPADAFDTAMKRMGALKSGQATATLHV